MLVWELVGAVVGAGLASGREIASFFSQHGHWSYAGIVLSAAVMLLLVDTQLPPRWRNRMPGRVWHLLLTLLLVFTGGAMLSGAGEVAALTLPVHGAYWFGVAGTLVLACFLANKTVSGLAWVSRILLSVLSVLILLGLKLPPMQGVNLREFHPSEALLRGLTYGGFNAALQWPMMSIAYSLPQGTRRRSACMSALLICCLLLLGNAVLLRHPVLISEAMPFLRMTAAFGQFGYILSSACLYLAILSTLTACLRGLGGSLLTTIGIVLVSLAGFTGVVEVAYPILGGGCFLMLVTAKFLNWFPNPFQSRKDML